MKHGNKHSSPPRAGFFAAIVALCVACAAFIGCGGGGADVLVPSAHAQPRSSLTLVFGDSITAGYMPVDGALQLRQDLSYTRELAGQGQVVTAAVGGATTAAAFSNQARWLAGLSADVVVILLGTNDAVAAVDRSAAMRNVMAIASAFPRARLVLVAPPKWPGLDAWLGEWALDLRAQALLAGAVFVDLHGASRPDWYCHPTDHHPCAPAHREIGALVAEAVARARS